MELITTIMNMLSIRTYGRSQRQLAALHNSIQAHAGLQHAGNPPPQPPLVLSPALACNPETPQEILWHIARKVPDLRQWLPANPKASPELLEVVSQLGGPGVKQALTVLLESLEHKPD